jgi:hypothetical protein
MKGPARVRAPGRTRHPTARKTNWTNSPFRRSATTAAVPFDLGWDRYIRTDRIAAGRDVKLAGIDFRVGNKFGLAYTPNRLVIFALMLGASTDPRRNHAHVTNREVLVT